MHRIIIILIIIMDYLPINLFFVFGFKTFHLHGFFPPFILTHERWGQQAIELWSRVSKFCDYLEIWRVVLGVWKEVIVVMFYGTAAWDPWLIVAQILCLQCLYYLSLGVFLTFLVGTRVSRMSLVYFFDYAAVTTSTVTGWCVIASFLLSSLAGWEKVFDLEINERQFSLTKWWVK